MATDTEGYRQSHMHKGSDYHADFTELPRRALLWRIEKRFLSDIVQRFLPGRRIAHLDFACGTGRILAHLANDVGASTGIDISASMLKVARSNAPNAEFFEADVTRGNVLGDRQFDLITAFRFFPNAEPNLRSDVIRALAPHLNPDGILVFNNHRNDSCLSYSLRRLVRLGRGGPRGMSQEEVHELLDSVGLGVRKVYNAGIVPEGENYPFWPRFWISWVENLASRLPIARWSEDLLYVCGKTV